MRQIARRFISVALFTIVSFTMLECGGDNSGDGGGEGGNDTIYQGAVAFNGGEDGTLSITIPESGGATRTNPRAQTGASVNITGECIYPDNTVSLDGSLDTDTGDFTLDGGGCVFTGNLNLDDGTFTGSVSCDDLGDGSFSGVDSTDGDTLVFCGSYDVQVENGTATGVWVLTVSGTSATGSYAGTDGGDSLVGTRNGNTVTVSVPDEGAGGYAEGTISGNSLTGTIYENGVPDGTFEGSTGACEG